MKKKVLILCFTDTHYDLRVARQIDFLKDTYDVCFAGYGLHCPDEVTFISLPPHPLTPPRKSVLAALLLARRYETAYWAQYPYQWLKQRVRSESFDIILANDIETLPLASFIRPPGAKLVFDAHEYAPRHFEDRRAWRLFFQGFNVHFCRKLIPQVDRMFTVSSGLAEEYHRHFGVLPRVMTNAASFHDLEPTPVDPSRIRLIHHGIATRSRKIENMIEMMRYADERFSLDLMLKIVASSASRQTKAYLHRLQSLAEATPRVRMIPPVLSRDVVPFIHRYDMGIFILEPVNFNYAHALPNKLFDFVQARLGIGISPSVDMQQVVEQHRLGVVAADFSPRALAERLNRLTTADVETFKQHSHTSAWELSADYNRTLLLDTFRALEDE